MPRFFLHYIMEGDRVDDVDGQEFSDLESARCEAVIGFRAIQGDRLLAGLPLQSGYAEIADEAGETVCRVSFQEALGLP